MGKKLIVYMIDGTEYGPRTVEIGNWVGKAIFTPRVSLPKIISRSEFMKPCIYIMKSPSLNTAISERIYIGEGEVAGDRLKQQFNDANKDFEELVFFISKDDFLTKAHIKYLESRIIKMAIDAKSADIENICNPTLPALHEAEISDLEYFLDQIKLILPIMGFKFLIPAVIDEKLHLMVSQNSIINYKIKSNIYKAEMYETDQGYIVTKGSIANLNMAPAVHGTYKDLQKKMISNGILSKSGKYFVFSEDAVFGSPSAAANIVLGRQTPGPLMWITSEGKTFKEIHE